MIDYGRFAERLAGRADRWGLLIEFQREWGYIGDANRGFAEPDEDQDADEDGLGDEDDDEEYCPIVPDAVAQWYALPQNSFMQASRLYWTHPHEPVTRFPTDEMLATVPGAPEERVPARRGIFMAEYEYCWTWSYLERDAAENPDPPVYVAATEIGPVEFPGVVEDRARLGEYLTARSFSEWALASAVVRVPFGMRLCAASGDIAPELYDPALVEQHAASEENELTDEQRARIRANFPELGLLPWCDFGVFELRGGPDVIIQLRAETPGGYPYWEGDFEFMIAARTKQALADALEVVGLEA